MATTVRPLTADRVEEAGALLAARHATQRAWCRLLPAGPEDPAVAAALVAGTLRFCDGLVALDAHGRLLGFLTGFEQVTDPTTPTARYAPARASVMLVQGHALADDVDPGPTYAELFGELAAQRLDAGIVDHIVHVPIGTPEVEAAWVALGFGRVSSVAVRDLAPTGRPAAPDVEVRIATADDLDAVDLLVDEEARFHARSPVFRPYLREQTRAAVRAELAAQLASDDHAFLVAHRGGVDVGVLSVGPSLGSPLYIPDGAAYIGATAVVPESRRGGVGAALADAAFEWCRDHGHRAACLHFATANRVSSSFWPGIGFVPAMAHLRRRLDERILTARPPAGAVS